MGAAVLVDVVDGILDAVHHFNAQFQVPVFSPEGLHFRGAEGQIGGELGACVNFHLEQRKARGSNRDTRKQAHPSSSRIGQQDEPADDRPGVPVA